MWSKLLKILTIGIAVAPTLIADGESVAAKINQDKGVLQKVHDGLDAALEALQIIQKVA